MKKLLIIFMLLSLGACSSGKLLKFGKQKAFDVKRFDSKAQYHTERMKYYVTRENEEHCFNSNPKNKEILTVEKGYEEYALQHFYNRIVKVNVKVVEESGYDTKVIFDSKDFADFKLEASSCIFDSYGGIFDTIQVTYISYRLAD